MSRIFEQIEAIIRKMLTINVDNWDNFIDAILKENLMCFKKKIKDEKGREKYINVQPSTVYRVIVFLNKLKLINIKKVDVDKESKIFYGSKKFKRNNFSPFLLRKIKKFLKRNSTSLAKLCKVIDGIHYPELRNLQVIFQNLEQKSGSNFDIKRNELSKLLQLLVDLKILSGRSSKIYQRR